MAVEWNFPAKKIQFLRIELVTIGVISLLIFVWTYYYFLDFLFAFMFTVIFLGIYAILGYISRLIQLLEHRYHVTATHFEVTRKTRFKSKKEKVPLKEIKHHKLDPLFLGGYLVSKHKKHVIYFNTKKELKEFESFLRKHVRKR
ncbi:hypothetical protein HY496_00390 [Candidatus Woesearchaeota archaeon]|nr:hypothetical protein [Candidatus Woesearchaeota archaeon]